MLKRLGTLRKLKPSIAYICRNIQSCVKKARNKIYSYLVISEIFKCNDGFRWIVTAKKKTLEERLNNTKQTNRNKERLGKENKTCMSG